MKLSSIRIDSMLGARAVHLHLSKPVTLICGHNGAGKSSIRDAITLSLTADLGRVALKKDAGQLVSDGAKALTVAVDAERDGQALNWNLHITAAGKITDKGPAMGPDLAHVLDAQRFARMSTAERRAFLFGLMGVSMSTAAVRERLLSRGCDAAKSDTVAPMLRAGFEPAAKEAKARATEAKGAWREVTGETWGSQKGEGWAPAPVDAPAAGQEAALSARWAAAQARVGELQQALGGAQARGAERARHYTRCAELREALQVHPRVSDKLARDRADLELWTKRADELQALAAGAPAAPRVGLVHELGWAVANLVALGDPLDPLDPQDARVLAALAAYEAEFGKVQPFGGADHDPTQLERQAGAAADLPAAVQSRDLMARAVAAGERQLADLAAKQTELAALVGAAPAEDAAGVSAAEIRRELEQAQAAEKADAEVHAKAVALARAADQRGSLAARAGMLHADVLAWAAIGDALSPNGLPAELLSEALTPFNDALAGHAEHAQWARVSIDADMEITADGRPYRLLSESEQWRTDAMIAAAVAQLSDLRLLVLDRVDVLDTAGREDALYWLDTLAEAGDIDTALLLGTLRQLPTGLPEHVQAVWVEQGRAVLDAVKAVADAGVEVAA